MVLFPETIPYYHPTQGHLASLYCTVRFQNIPARAERPTVYIISSQTSFIVFIILYIVFSPPSLPTDCFPFSVPLLPAPVIYSLLLLSTFLCNQWPLMKHPEPQISLVLLKRCDLCSREGEWSGDGEWIPNGTLFPISALRLTRAHRALVKISALYRE